MQKSNNTIGLQALTPIYGQLIQAAPSWSGPYVPPPIPPPIEQPKQPSEFGRFVGLFGNVALTGACMIGAPEFAMACPLLGQGADIGINQLFNM